MSEDNQPTTPKNDADQPDSGEVRDPQALTLAAAAFAGGLIGAIIGGIVT